MDILENFALKGLAGGPDENPPANSSEEPLGLLSRLVGKWKGTGFNQIWRPSHEAPGHFLELNQTLEQIEFVEVPGNVPNRGLLQGDINLRALSYQQQVQDAVVRDAQGDPAGLHFEPGLWLSVPATSDPRDLPSVARLGTIPHGTSVLAQGPARTTPGGPTIDPVSITPFRIGHPDKLVPFPETDLSHPLASRTAGRDIPDVTQALVNNPNLLLLQALAGQAIETTTTFRINTAPGAPHAPHTGGGTSNIAFLQGAAEGPNARAVEMDAIFWVEEVQQADGSLTLQLQYTQRVLLNFRGLSWPHVSVATLVKVSD